MPHIVLTDEQIRALREANGAIEARRKVVTFLQPLEPYVVEAILKHRERRAKGGPREPGIPSGQVQAFLRRLHEIADREGMDEAKMRDLLRRRRAGEEV